MAKQKVVKKVAVKKSVPLPEISISENSNGASVISKTGGYPYPDGEKNPNVSLGVKKNIHQKETVEE